MGWLFWLFSAYRFDSFQLKGDVFSTYRFDSFKLKGDFFLLTDLFYAFFKWFVCFKSLIYAVKMSFFVKYLPVLKLGSHHQSHHMFGISPQVNLYYPMFNCLKVTYDQRQEWLSHFTAVQSPFSLPEVQNQLMLSVGIVQLDSFINSKHHGSQHVIDACGFRNWSYDSSSA